MKYISSIIKIKNTDSVLLIGSGASLDYLPYSSISKTFIEKCYVIVVSDLCYDKNIAYDFCINHHTVKDLPDWYLPKLQEQINLNPGKFILSEYDCNDPARGTTQLKGSYYKYKGLPVCETTNLFVDPIINPKPDTLFVGGSILFDAIGFGLFLGASNFYLLGFDGGKYEGHSYYSTYRQYWEEDDFYVTGHSIRTMNMFKSLQEWIRPLGVNFIHLSARYGSSNLSITDWDNWQYKVICPE